MPKMANFILNINFFGSTMVMWDLNSLIWDQTHASGIEHVESQTLDRQGIPKIANFRVTLENEDNKEFNNFNP